jgi:hypothetical protein
LKLHVLLGIAAFSAFFILADTATAADAPTAARTIADIKALLASHKPDQKRLDELQAILKTPEPQTTDNKTLANYYRQRAEAADQSADEMGALGAMEKVVVIGDPQDGFGFSLSYLSDLQERVSSVYAAIETSKRRIKESQGTPIPSYSRLVNLYAQIDIDEAGDSSARSEK